MIAKNHCLMQLRQKGVMMMDSIPDLAADENVSLQHHFENEKRFEKLEEALELLKEDQKACIKLFYLEKKSYREISSITGESEMQVKSNIQNGKRNLKILMTKK